MSAGPEPQPVQLVPVYVTSAIRTPAGPGPGVRHLPPDEAARLISARLAIPGSQPPRGMDGRPDDGLRH